MASETGSVVITVPPETLIASGFGLTMRNYSQGLRKRRRKKLTNSNIRAPIVARRVNRKIDPPTRRLPDLLRDVRELVVEARLRSDGLEVRVLRGGSGRVHRVPTRVRELDRVVADGGGATPDQDALGLLGRVRRGVEVETDVEGLYGGEVGDLEFGERRGVGARRMREGEGKDERGERNLRRRSCRREAQKQRPGCRRRIRRSCRWWGSRYRSRNRRRGSRRGRA